MESSSEELKLSEKTDQKNPRPRLVLNFSADPKDMPAYAWEELVLLGEDCAPRMGPGDEPEKVTAHDIGHRVCKVFFEDWARQARADRVAREEEAAAEAEALDNDAKLSKMDDATKLASVDDAAALVARLKELDPSWVGELQLAPRDAYDDPGADRNEPVERVGFEKVPRCDL